MGDGAAGIGGLWVLLAVTSTDARQPLQGPRAWWELSSNSQGLRRMPPAPPACPPTEIPRQQQPCRGVMGALLRVPEPVERSGSSSRTRGSLEKGSPQGPDPCPWPHPSAQLVSPTQCRGPKITFYFGFSVALVESWLVSGGRVSYGSSHRFLSRVHLY